MLVFENFLEDFVSIYINIFLRFVVEIYRFKLNFRYLRFYLKWDCG